MRASLLVFSVIVGISGAYQLPRRGFLHKMAEATTAASLPAAANAAKGDMATFGLPDKSEADAGMGMKADSFGDESRENGLYAQAVRQKYSQVDREVIQAKLTWLKASVARLEKKIAPALSKGSWAPIVDACNAELYGFRQAISEVAKQFSGGKVCLIDESQRGLTMPKGLDPDDCPLQLLQVAVLGDLNQLYTFANLKKMDLAGDSFAKFLKDFDAFILAAQVK